MKPRVMKRHLILAAVFALTGCAADQPMGNMGHREQGTILGAVGGAVIGAVATADAEERMMRFRDAAGEVAEKVNLGEKSGVESKPVSIAPIVHSPVVGS